MTATAAHANHNNGTTRSGHPLSKFAPEMPTKTATATHKIPIARSVPHRCRDQLSQKLRSLRCQMRIIGRIEPDAV